MASQGGDSDLLEKLYPLPLSTGVTPFPGPTLASAQAVLTVLKHNYQAHHNFFNDLGWHKYVQLSHLQDTAKSRSHATHHVWTLYTMGASPEIIADAYKTAHDYLLPAIKNPGPITEENYAEHLGDERSVTFMQGHTWFSATDSGLIGTSDTIPLISRTFPNIFVITPLMKHSYASSCPRRTISTRIYRLPLYKT